ncbi:MAG: hypothetical protein GYA86_04140 [Firmicutes bacterium]|nr:hypothetical protein [Bacillota bacterium]
MNCPGCHNEMEPGFLQGRQRVAWVKKRHGISLNPRQGEVLLENNAFKDFLLRAYICKSCQMIIVDYTDKKIREG